MKPTWSTQQSLNYYLINKWGFPYFNINKNGNLICTPKGKSTHNIDIKQLIDNLIKNNINPPILVRFNDILKDRINIIHKNFYQSIKIYKYKGSYTFAMPIKVNQQKHVVKKILKYGKKYSLGLETGSKPEFIAAIFLQKKYPSIIICNGYKDKEYINIALNAQKTGLQTFLILDQFSELKQIIKTSKKLNIKPNLGLRAKLSNKSKGRWKGSSGDKSKFGLFAKEIIQTIKTIKKNKIITSLKLLHFHVGSQITSINSIQKSLKEAAQLYCNLRKMGCSDLQYIDVGGGLAVDYSGGKTNFHSSMNYSIQEYTNNIISTIQNICDKNKEPHPNIISESGRALSAHYTILIFNVLGCNSSRKTKLNIKEVTPIKKNPTILYTIWNIYKNINKKNFQDSFNNATLIKEESKILFNHGIIKLKTKAKVEDVYWKICKNIYKNKYKLNHISKYLKDLQKHLSNIYYCNFSIFQSIPDAWAIKHLFPVIPIHRLNEKPKKDVILADLTCDSDGKLDQFIGFKNVKNTLKLHPLNEQPYYLGAFSIGAYQEILGNLHNLFGNTNAIHITIKNNGNYYLDHITQGNSINKILSYLQYNNKQIIKSIKKITQKAIKTKKITIKEGFFLLKKFKNSLLGYTYLKKLQTKQEKEY